MSLNPFAKGESLDKLARNNVSAEGQLKASQYVWLECPDAKGIRVLFAGNSITLHGARPELGWHFDWGMAASCKEKDYVHLVEQEILGLCPDATFCICQGAEWELHYQNGIEKHAPACISKTTSPRSARWRRSPRTWASTDPIYTSSFASIATYRQVGI